MSNLMGYAQLTQLCGRSPFMQKIMRTQNHIISRYLVVKAHTFGVTHHTSACIIAFGTEELWVRCISVSAVFGNITDIILVAMGKLN